jgi:C1A family cysteine protease
MSGECWKCRCLTRPEKNDQVYITSLKKKRGTDEVRQRKKNKTKMSSPLITLSRGTVLWTGLVALIVVVALAIALVNCNKKNKSGLFVVPRARASDFRNPTSRAYYFDKFDDDRGCIPNPTRAGGPPADPARFRYKFATFLEAPDTYPLRIVNTSVIRATSPETFDGWRQKNLFRPPRDQGQCGSCWAFAIAGMLGSRMCIIRNRSTPEEDLSTQIIVSCDSRAMKCQGASSLEDAVQGITLQNLPGGLMTEAECPYSAEDASRCSGGSTGAAANGGTDTCCDDLKQRVPGCQPPAPRRGVTVSSVNALSDIQGTNLDEATMEELQKNLEVMKNAILNHGPIVTAMFVYSDFMDWTPSKGPYHSPPGSSSATAEGGHAIQIVGWGPNYWICQNSWGTGWGDGGFWQHQFLDFGCKLEACALEAAPCTTDGTSCLVGQTITVTDLILQQAQQRGLSPQQLSRAVQETSVARNISPQEALDGILAGTIRVDMASLQSSNVPPPPMQDYYGLGAGTFVSRP